jgi:hypothetical protein
MNPALRPMSLGEILDRAIHMVRGNLGLFVGITVIPGLAALGYSLSMQISREKAVPGHALFGLAAIGFGIAQLILFCLAEAAMCWAAARILFEQPVSVRAAYGAFRGRKASLVGLAFTKNFLSFWPMIPVLMLIGVVLSEIHAGFGGGVMGITMIAAMVVCGPLVARYLLAFPATAITGSNVHFSLRRSVELGRGFRWKVFWAYAVPIGIQMVLLAASGALVPFLTAGYGLAGHGAFVWQTGDEVWTLVVKLIFEPVCYIALTLTYYDLCVRKEALDVSFLMEQAGMAEYAPLPFVTQPGGEQL